MWEVMFTLGPARRRLGTDYHAGGGGGGDKKPAFCFMGLWV